jgi:hypothetical protein
LDKALIPLSEEDSEKGYRQNAAVDRTSCEEVRRLLRRIQFRCEPRDACLVRRPNSFCISQPWKKTFASSASRIEKPAQKVALREDKRDAALFLPNPALEARFVHASRWEGKRIEKRGFWKSLLN